MKTNLYSLFLAHVVETVVGSNNAFVPRRAMVHSFHAGSAIYGARVTHVLSRNGPVENILWNLIYWQDDCVRENISRQLMRN